MSKEEKIITISAEDPKDEESNEQIETENEDIIKEESEKKESEEKRKFKFFSIRKKSDKASEKELEKKKSIFKEKYQKKSEKSIDKYIDDINEVTEDEHEEVIDMDKFRRDRNKLRFHKRIKKVLIVFVIIIISAVIGFTGKLWIPEIEKIFDGHQKTIVNDGTAQSGNFPIKIDYNDGITNKIKNIDSGIVVSDGQGISIYNTNGKLTESSITLEYSSPIIKTAGKRMLIYYYEGTVFKAYNKSVAAYDDIKTEKSILYGDIAKNGNIVIVTEDEKYGALMTAYDKNGNKIYQWGNGNRITNVSFTDDPDICIISTFAVKDGEMYSQVHKIDLNNDEKVMESQYVDGIIIRSIENSDGNIWAVGDKTVYLIDKKGNMTDCYEYPFKIESFDMSSECLAIVGQNTGDKNMRLIIFDSSKENVQPYICKTTSRNPKKVLCYNDMALVLSSENIDAYSSKGNFISTAEISDEYTDFVYSNDAVYLLSRRELNKIKFKT